MRYVYYILDSNVVERRGFSLDWGLGITLGLDLKFFFQRRTDYCVDLLEV